VTRRLAAKLAGLIAFSAAFGKFDLLAQEPHGTIRVPLSDWKFLGFDYQGQRVVIETKEIFTALEEVFGAAPIPSPVLKRK
jgi:hypothetical protein